MMIEGRNRKKVAAIGEVMVEFSSIHCLGTSGDHYGLGFAGDTFNTAVTLARLGTPVVYVTRLGDDAFSDRMLERMVMEGVDTDAIERVPGRQPGLYVIANTADGERTFRYWRSESPARELWSSGSVTDRLELILFDCSCLYLSGITLAIMGKPARDRLREFLQRYRRGGGRVIFDSNYRERLWMDIEEARAVIGDFLEVCDLALLTLEDEQYLWGNLSPPALTEHHRRRGILELVLKRGADTVYVWDGSSEFEISVPAVADVVDTTGAGDAFNAGYLAMRLLGSSCHDAVAMGNRAAAAVIRRPGGLVDRQWFLDEMKLPIG